METPRVRKSSSGLRDVLVPCKGHGPGLWTQSWVQCRPGPCCCIVEANGYLPQASSSHLIHQGKAVSLRQSWRINYDDTPNYLKTPQHMVGIKYMVSSPHASFHPLKLCSQAGSTKPLTASTASQQSISDPFLNTLRDRASYLRNSGFPQARNWLHCPEQMSFCFFPW